MLLSTLLLTSCAAREILSMSAEELEALNEKSKSVARMGRGVDTQALDQEREHARELAQQRHNNSLALEGAQNRWDLEKKQAEADAEAARIRARANADSTLEDARARTEAAKMRASVPTQTARSCYILVAPYDTWSFLMNKHGFSAYDSEIMRLNRGIDINRLSVNQKINMPTRCCPGGGQPSPCVGR